MPFSAFNKSENKENFEKIIDRTFRKQREYPRKF